MYPSRLQDDGYDIAHFHVIHPSYGTVEDFQKFMDAAHDRGLRVLADLVVNHTSDQHPWFQAARADRRSPYRDYYVWTDDPSREKGTTEDNWKWVPETEQYYLHRFQPFQADLNIANPAVRTQIAKTVGFWLTLGVSGFRMDAVPFLCEEIGAEGVSTSDGRHWLHELREYGQRRRGDMMLMGEVNVGIDDVAAYF